MPDTSRLDELRRRVQQDPASIAFAALADEYRRAGLFEQAIETCRAGLVRHPAYLSARVTLGRSLMEIGEYDEAREHLEQVIRVAPENLAAIRALAEIHHRRGDSPDAYAAAADALAAAKPPTPPPARIVPMPPRAAQPLAPAVPAVPPALQSEPRQTPEAPLSIAKQPVVPAVNVPSTPGVETPLATEAAGATATVARRAPEPTLEAAPPAVPVPPRTDPVRERLEQLLAAIARARASRGAVGSLTTR